MRRSVIHCIMEKSGSGSAMKSNSLFSKNVLSLVLVIGCLLCVCFSNNILELPMTFFNYQIANSILHYRNYLPKPIGTNPMYISRISLNSYRSATPNQNGKPCYRLTLVHKAMLLTGCHCFRISVKSIGANIRFSFRNCILIPPFGIQDSRSSHGVADGVKLSVTFNPKNHGLDSSTIRISSSLRP